MLTGDAAAAAAHAHKKVRLLYRACDLQELTSSVHVPKEVGMPYQQIL